MVVYYFRGSVVVFYVREQCGRLESSVVVYYFRGSVVVFYVREQCGRLLF